MSTPSRKAGQVVSFRRPHSWPAHGRQISINSLVAPLLSACPGVQRPARTACRRRARRSGDSWPGRRHRGYRGDRRWWQPFRLAFRPVQTATDLFLRRHTAVGEELAVHHQAGRADDANGRETHTWDRGIPAQVVGLQQVVRQVPPAWPRFEATPLSLAQRVGSRSAGHRAGPAPARLPSGTPAAGTRRAGAYPAERRGGRRTPPHGPTPEVSSVGWGGRWLSAPPPGLPPPSGWQLSTLSPPSIREFAYSVGRMKATVKHVKIRR